MKMLEVPPNLFPKEKEEKAVWFRRRLAYLKQEQSRYIPFAWIIILPCCILVALFASRLLKLPLLSTLAPALLLGSLAFTLYAEAMKGGESQKRIEAHWDQAFSENYVLPLSLLIEGVRTLSPDLNIEAQKRLTAALTTPQIAEYETLTLDEKQFLVRELGDGKKGRQLLMLYLAEHYGGAETLGKVETIVRDGNARYIYHTHPELMSTKDGLPLYDPEVVEAAKRVLPLLQDRLDPLRSERVLLRPSEAPPLPETLLRAVYNASPEDETLLLRATSDSRKTEE